MSLEALHSKGQAARRLARRSKPSRLVFALFLCTALGLSGCGGNDAPGAGSGDAAPETASPAVSEPAVLTESAPTEAAEPEGWIGVVVAREAVDVAAEVPGRVDSVAVRPGDRVSPGDLLARLDTSQLAQDLAMAEASLEAVRAEVRRTKSELQESTTRHERRAAVPDTFSREELAATELEKETAEASAAAAEAREREQSARVRQLRESLSKTDVRAPFESTVALRYLDPGSTVVSGTPIVRLITSEELLVRFAVPPEATSDLALGDPVEIVLERSGTRVTGRVAQVAPEIDSASQMIFLEARLDEENPGGAARAGLVARVFPMPS